MLPLVRDWQEADRYWVSGVFERLSPLEVLSHQLIGMLRLPSMRRQLQNGVTNPLGARKPIVRRSTAEAFGAGPKPLMGVLNPGTLKGMAAFQFAEASSLLSVGCANTHMTVRCAIDRMGAIRAEVCGPVPGGGSPAEFLRIIE